MGHFWSFPAIYGMSILFFCPSGHLLSAADSWQDRKVRCPCCAQRVIVPARSEGTPFEPPPGLVPLDIPAENDELPDGEQGSKPPSDEVPIDWENDVPEVHASPAPSSPPAPLGSHQTNPVLWMPDDTYQADRVWVQRTYWLAVVLAGIAFFGTIPALPYSNLRTAPGWACAALLIAAMQLVYIGWMAATPDWLSVRVTMVVFATAASLYAATAAMALATPLAEPLPLALDGVRAFVIRWSIAVLLLMLLGVYLSGRVSTRWKRMIEPRGADRRRPPRPGLNHGVTTA